MSILELILASILALVIGALPGLLLRRGGDELARTSGDIVGAAIFSAWMIVLSLSLIAFFGGVL